MKIEVRPATLRDLTWTAANAREIDKREVLAAGPRTMTEAGYITWHCTQEIGGAGYVVWIDGQPETAFGFTCQSFLTPWLFSAWAWGSDKFALCMPAIAAWSREDLFPLISDKGMVRIEARSLAEHEEAHRWLLWMHFAREADLVDWGRDRSRFVLFAWTRSEFARRLRSGQVRGFRKEAAQSFLDSEPLGAGDNDVLRVKPAGAATAAGNADDRRRVES